MIYNLKKLSFFLRRSYVWFCVCIISLYFLALSLGTARHQFDRVYLPNGAYLARKSFTSFQSIVLRDIKGNILVDRNIEFVCFNDYYAQGYTYDPEYRGFIYEKGQKEAVYSKDTRYSELWKRSGLSSSNRGCTGDLNMMTGFENLLRYPQYRKPPPSRK